MRGNGETVLLDVLTGAAEATPGQVIVHVGGDGDERTVTHHALLADALRVAGGLLDAGLAPGSHVVVPAERSEEFLPLFWGVVAAGLVPVPLASDVRRVLPVWEFLGRPPVAVGESTVPLLDALPDSVRPLALDALREHPAPPRLPERAPGDVAFLQFSSGSTGTPKGVELTHAAVLANLTQIRTAAGITCEDVIATWMPYFHDMGLIGTHLVPLAARIKQVRLEPLTFAKRPARWLEAAERHRATLLSAANFALALVERRVPEDVLARLDLSRVRMILVGAEPISPAVWRSFARRMGPTGLAPDAPQPVYGLAEATLAVTFPPPGEVTEPLALDRAALGLGRAVDTVPGPDAVELMDVGRPVPGCVVRITDHAGEPVGDRRVGHIEVRGPQVARGYHRAPKATADAFADGWLRTGDLGFLRDGRLCVTGRSKDVVFVDGRTFHAADLEEVAAGTPGLGRGPVAVVGSTDPAGGGERVVVFLATPPAAAPVTVSSGLLRDVRNRVRAAVGHDDVRVLALPVRAFPRTTSGKLRRGVLRDRFERGEYPQIGERGATGSLGAGRESGATGVGVGREGGAAGVGAGGEGGAAGARAGGEGGGAATGAGREGGAAGARAGREGGAARDVRSVVGGSAARSAPRSLSEVEAVVLGVWARVLGLPVEEIGSHDDFRALGGSSLKAMEVLAALEDEFGVRLRPSDIRDHATVAALTGMLLTAGDPSHGPSDGPASGEPPSSPSPERSAHGVAPVVAVSAVACRFPGADTPEAFWDRLVEGYDAVTDVPAGRWADASDREARRGAFLDDPAGFDAEFFGIGDEEARTTAPQARILLELAHEALERAGYAGARRRGRRVGVFVAAGDSGYRRILEQAYGERELPVSALTGNLPNMLAARVAHCLDLTGPALAVDTACSSALVALHLARRSLQAGECDVAVVGGVHLNLTPGGYALLEKAQALSPTGRCHAFGAAADGFVPGEGGAALVLTRLDEAERAGDPVLALLRGTAVNNDGRSLSLMAPNPLTQREVITRAYRESDVDPESVSYVEAHGTGTPVGDPVEVRSLAHAFPPRADGTPRLLGSVKTNVGHLLNAAGMPSLVKVVLALGRRRLPPTPHPTTPAPALDLAGSGFALLDEERAWVAPGPLVAGVNAFGFGGTNAHAVLEEAPARAVREPARDHAVRGDASAPAPRRSAAAASGGPRLLTLSAYGADALRTAAVGLADHLRDHPHLDEGDVCATVAAARDEGPDRLAVVADGDLADRLAALGGAAPVGDPVRSRARLVLLLPGQGARSFGQARALYADAPAFREALDEASGHAGLVGGRSLAAWCLDADAPAGTLAGTEVAQPLLVAYGVALARQVRAWGVTPDAVAGHSVGEITAACVAGSLSLADAVRFAAERGRLMAELCAPGAMAAVRCDEDAVAPLVAGARGSLSVAAVNGPDQVVLAGTEAAVEGALDELAARGIATRRLGVSRAFHSPLMEPALGPLGAAARALTFRPSATPLLSTVTAAWQPVLDPAHLRDHARRQVRFGAAVDRLLSEGYDTFVELGSASLGGSVRAVAAGHPRGSRVLALTAGSRDGAQGLLDDVGRLWQRGVPLDRTAMDAGRRRVTVPTYPFRRRRHWPDAAPVPRPLLHGFRWDDAPLTPGPGPRTVLLGGPDSPFARAFAERLTGRGVIVRRAGEPLPDGAPAPSAAVLLAGPAVEPDSAADLDAAHRAMVTALQGLLPQLALHRPRVLVVTEDVHVTGTGTERPRPAQAVLTGLTLALPEELPGVEARSVDLSTLDEVAVRLDALDHELSARTVPTGGHGGGFEPARAEPTGSEGGGFGPAWAVPTSGGGRGAGCEPAPVLAWRGGRRLGRTTRPVPPPVVDGPGSREALPVDGVYLITGGAGGVGGALARDLARRGRPTLVLTGRSTVPPEGLLAELRTLGATAEYRTADVSREADVDALLAALPRLDVLMHAAGTVRPGTLRAKSPDDVAEVLAAKTRGTLLLARGLLAHELRPAVCVAFSSVASVLPGLAGAIGDYAAANAYLDAFAAAERAAGRPWLAVNFAAFAGTGLLAASGAPVVGTGGVRGASGVDNGGARGASVVGTGGVHGASGVDNGGARGAFAVGARRGPVPLETETALEALRAACRTDAGQLMVADLVSAPAPRRDPVATAVPPSPGAVAGAAAEAGAGVARAASAAQSPPPLGTGVEPRVCRPAAAGGVQAVLRQLLSEALHVSPDDLGDDVPLLGLGLDSLMAVDLVKRLETELSRSLPITLFFEHRTLGELARQLGSEDVLSPAPGPDAPSAGAADLGVPFSLTPVQLAFHTLGELYPDIAAYGYVTQDVRGPLDADLLGRALGLLAERHAMLRLRILPGEAAPTQVVVPSGHEAVPPWYEVRDLPGGLPAEEELARLEEALRNRPFDLTSEAPIRAVLARTGTAGVAGATGAARAAAADGTTRVTGATGATNAATGTARAAQTAPTAHTAHTAHTAQAGDIAWAPDAAVSARLVVVVHHAAADGFSLNILGEELWTLYTALSRGYSPELPPLASNFAAYAAHERAERSEAALAEDRAYWREALARRGAPLALPYDGDPLGPPAPPLLAHQVTPGPGVSAALREAAAAHGVSLFHLLLAAYARCLSRWGGGGKDVSVNVARARRETRLPGVDRLVGPLADTLPVPVHVHPDVPVHALAVRLRDAWPESERHGRLTSADLARLMPVDGAGPRTAGPASFSFARFPVSLDPECPVRVRPTSAGTASAATRLSLLCWESDGELSFSWNFPARLFERTTIARLAREHLAELSEAAGVTGAARLTEAARLAGAAGLTATTGPSPAPAGEPSEVRPDVRPDMRSDMRPDIVARLCARFRATPDAVAVDTGDGVMTYAELDQASRALAGRLRVQGVAPGDPVGLLTAPGADTVTGVVGILRAGAGWVPLDAAHPPARLADQLERSGARTLVCHAETRTSAAEPASAAGVSLVMLDGPASEPRPEPAEFPAPGPDALAYVIFTSGSTGRPKAVPITRRAMTNYLDWALATFAYDAGDRLAQTASVCFDASVRQLLAPLLVGATVVTLPRQLLRDPEALLDRVESARISVWSSVPSLWSRLLEAAETRRRDGAAPPDLSALRWIHVGGEVLPPAHVRRWYDLFGSGQRIANLYGPTEATINATFHIVDSRPADDVRVLPIGTPVTGTEVDVVAADGRRCAPGESGELHIAGVGLTPGYLGEPGLTAAAFVERDGRRWYRSGDRVRRDGNGVLEFLGRLDDQVKVRGHRVEPGEVESVLLAHPAVTRAAVVLRDERLNAFVQRRPGVPDPDPTVLRAHLARTLPEYMLPGRIHVVDDLPLTGTGKIDRARLGVPERRPVAGSPPGPITGPAAEVVVAAFGTASAPEAVVESRSVTAPGAVTGSAPEAVAGATSVAAPEAVAGSGGPVVATWGTSAPAPPSTPPTTPTEVLLARVWSELLDMEEVRREDDFFELGGDSLLVLQVFARLRQEIRSLPRPTVVYAHRTLAALAAVIDRTPTDAETVDSAGPVTRGDAHGPSPFPLTPSQRGFLLAEAMAPGSDTAWLSCLRIDGPLRRDAFQRAVDACVVRHPMLRTVFPAGARPPVQQELPPALRLPVDFETLAEPGLLASRITEERARRFEPWAWPLLRLRLLTLGPAEHALVVHAHHLIGDGYSVALLGRELLSVYDRVVRGESAELPPLHSTFRDHVNLQERLACAAEGRGRLDEPYRRPVLGGRVGAGSPDPVATAPPYRSTGFTLDADQVAALRGIASGAGTTLFAPVLTAYYRTLAATTGQDDLILGLAVSGRDDARRDADRVFGPYAAAVPLRPGPAPGAGGAGRTFAEDLRAVVAEVEAARTEGVGASRGDGGLPPTAQFFFTFLDFSSLGPLRGDTLSLRWDEDDTVLAPPPVGTDTFLAVRPVGAGELRVTLRASTAAFPDEPAFAAFTDALRRGMTMDVRARAIPDAAPVTAPAPVPDSKPSATRAPASQPTTTTATATVDGAASASARVSPSGLPPALDVSLDSALVGYLPPPGQLAALGGAEVDATSRDELRRLLFPGGRPRLVEEIGTRLGRSGFVCLPLFADELASTPDLAGRTARAVEHAAALGARCVSLAGMIPSLTAYGYGVLRETEAPIAVTTGHAATVVSVVTTVHAALARTGRELGGLVVAVAGLGSIGGSSLELLLARAAEPPARLLLCDVAGSAPRLRHLADDLIARGLVRGVEVHESGPALPVAVYEADLLITAVSGGGAVLDVSRLRPGSIVVDDSFPHCFDVTGALARMRERRDVLIIGGGLLSVGAVERRTAPGLPPAAAAGYAARSWLPGTIASCRLESLLRAAHPELPLVHGLVDGRSAGAHWRVMEAAGVEAGPLHLLGHVVGAEDGDLEGFPSPRSRPRRGSVAGPG
ncbi:amino acid adenylation domain-containing protein [Streptomyces sp. NPDC058700]|uniref:amino acid adenylation domain-containing protein n=1 Tax=Streptomyces sp. NPDC058700 TaxID=3346607 RepID=UPI00365515A9